jgi:hypothetical protein
LADVFAVMQTIEVNFFDRCIRIVDD